MTGRIGELLAALTVAEKVAQLTSYWDRVAGAGVSAGTIDRATAFADGLGQLTRPLGSAPVDPIEGARSLARIQAEIQAANRWAIPALVHEECLTGLSTWRATAFPTPLAWGASFDPALVEQMAHHIGVGMRAAGIHQGLAPLLDVCRDHRWGRTEETIGEDPYLVGTIGTAYVSGLERAGVIATVKHFAGYPASRAGRNLAPVDLGRRQLVEVYLTPFEMAVRDGGARSVMTSYSAIDGVPSTADPFLLDEVLRLDWGFTGTVVSDYFAVRFLHEQHRVADSAVAAATAALRAGVDVELPTRECYGPDLVAEVEAGRLDEGLVDRALRRVLDQKQSLGLLENDYDPLPDGVDDLDLDDDVGRGLALRLARESIVLLHDDGGVLPVAPGASLAVIGPLAGDRLAGLGCYTFPVRAGAIAPGCEPGIDLQTVVEVLGALHGADLVTAAAGCGAVDDPDRSRFPDAVRVTRAADICVVVVGDRSGHFGRGTSGEGCDAPDLRLPGVQEDLVAALIDSGTPVVLVVLSGRPYALGAVSHRVAAVVQAFLPGQSGATALAEILTGVVSPSGRLPVCIPRHPFDQPAGHLAPVLGRRHAMSSIDPAPLFPFGAGTGYTTFTWGGPTITVGRGSADGRAHPSGPLPGRGGDLAADADVVDWPIDGEVALSLEITNTGDRTGTEVVQLYLHDPVARVVRPEMRLVGYARVELDPGRVAAVTFTVPADLAAFADGHDHDHGHGHGVGVGAGEGGQGALPLVVEPGPIELRVARSSAEVHAGIPFRLVGPERRVGHRRRLTSDVTVRAVPGGERGTT